MIEKILQHEVFLKKPPLLIDVGASGNIHPIWKKIAKYSICIAFDADDRDLDISKQTGKGYKEFYMVNRVVSNENITASFYLTKSPHCSSALKTNLEKLKIYNLKSSFEIIKELSLPTITITEALNNVGYSHIDWFKTDSQGTDLRIFSIIEESIINKVLVAEFEPGIMDAYEGEDKLWKLMAYFDDKDFWSDQCVIKGMSRLSENIIHNKFFKFEKKFISAFQKSNAFWAEISYMNNMKVSDFTERDFLLMIVFSLIKKQYGFALEISEIGYKRFNNLFFNEINAYAFNKMRIDAYKKIPFHAIYRLYKKYFI